MAEQKVQYTVEVNRTGTGGADAARELQGVAAAAGAVNAAGTRTTAAMTSLATTGKSTSIVFKSLGGVIQVAGFQAFPQLTAAAMVTNQAMHALRVSGVALTASFATVGAGVAGLIAALVSAGFAWSAYKAKQNEALTAKDLADKTTEFAGRLKEQVVELREAGAITIEVYERLGAVLGKATAGGNQTVRDFIRDQERGSAQQRIGEFNREAANRSANRQFTDPVVFDLGRTDAGQGLRVLEAQSKAQRDYSDEVALYNQLRQESLITEKELAALSLEADTAKTQRLTAINAQVNASKISFASLRDIQKDAIMQFAGGLASTLVDVKAWTEDAGAAFSKFFADLSASIAQAIIQMLILRALKSAFPSMFAAAGGGVFPRMMAAGGVAGVAAVSSPTYFPKFNVMAGEAGREMLAVLARPRMMEVGGMQAIVGNAAGNKLALTNADDLQRTGGTPVPLGGTLTIEVRHSPETEARIINNSVQGAVVRVTQDVGRHTRLREAVKGASG